VFSFDDPRPWIEPPHQQISQQGQHLQQDGVEEHRSENERVIAIHRSLNEMHSDAGDCKDLFDDQRTGEHRCRCRAER